MLIDPNTQNAQLPPNTQASLSPELAKLVADLKLSLGQSLEAMVTRVQVVTEAERQELLSQQPVASKNQAGRQMQSLLQEPALKLVELKIQQHLVPTLTALPLAKAQAIQVLLTPRGLMLVPPAQQQPSTAGAPQVALRPSSAAATPPIHTSVKPAPLANLSVTSPTPPASPTPQAPAGPSTNNSAGSPLMKANADHPPVKLPAPEAVLIKTAGLTKRDLPTSKLTASPTIPEATAKPHKPAVPSSIAASQIRPLIAETLARTLPQAKELPPLLRALGELNRQLLTVPRANLPPQLREMQTLLNKLPALSLNLPQVNPARPEALRQALQQSGVFYERRLLQSVETGLEQAARKLPEQDLKGALIQIQQWLTAATATAPLPTRASTPDTLSQLLFGLVQIFLPQAKPQRETNALQQLKSAVQQHVDQSLARIQTQQMRSLNSRLLDPDAPQQVHLDIPLRLPEGYGNLYLHLFEPRLTPEPDKESKKKEQPRQSKSRWRVFMELMLDELGGLAAEISVLEQDVEITLWTEGETLRERANTHLRDLRWDLEQQGLVVRELQCSQHPPPEQKVQLDYALIDIKT